MGRRAPTALLLPGTVQALCVLLVLRVQQVWRRWILELQLAGAWEAWVQVQLGQVPQPLEAWVQEWQALRRTLQLEAPVQAGTEAHCRQREWT